jgi:hypothetical protein
MRGEQVISRHRLPKFFRVGLAVLWLTPIVLLSLAILISRGMLDLRLLPPMLLMAVPAAYVWQEGVDVLPSGIVSRTYWPRYYPYICLQRWNFNQRDRVLTVWDTGNRKALECRPGHLTDLPGLLAALKSHVPYHPWPR